MTSASGVLVDDNVLEVLRKAQLDNFINKFVFLFNVRRFDHFSHVRDKDMQEIGMQQQQIRELREQILKMSRELWNRSDPKQIYVQSDHSTSVQNTIDERAIIPSEQVKLYELLGEGSFAVVKRGVWQQSNGHKIDVAVKILRDISPNIMEDLRVEASHLLKLQHPSLIRMYGIVRQPAMMVFELCEGGSLLDRLRDDKKIIPLVSRLHDYCIQIAKALQFLESKHCVHRDVAARNILLTKDEKTVKICDFGLMRALKENEQMYTMAPQKKVPFAWCPPEALRHRKFSHASDVWSYGVTIWEVFTFGEEPWVGCRAIDVLKNIDAGETLEKPKYCSERIYQIMRNCWRINPAERCKFGAIREDLKAAMFLDAVARESYNSIQPGTLQLAKGDEVVVVENTGSDWFGQNKKNQKFGTFPRTTVFAQMNNAVAADSAVTPQKVPTAPTIRVQPQQQVQLTPLQVSSKPLNNNTKTSFNDRSSRISMPVAGSFIHTGHGDPLGGQSWGNPAAIDSMYLKNPVRGVPLSSMSNGAEIIASKELLTNGGRSTHIPAAPISTTAMPKIRGLSLDLPEYDDFDRAFDDGFSPSKIELPRDFGSNSVTTNESSMRTADSATPLFIERVKSRESSFDIRGNVLKPTPVEKVERIQNIPNNSVNHPSVLIAPTNSGVTSIQLPDLFSTPQPHSSFGVESLYSTRSLQTQPGSFTSAPIGLSRNTPHSFIPELQSRLNPGDTISMRPRPGSSIGLQSSGMDSYNTKLQRPFSEVKTTTNPVVQQPAPMPCLVPTPAPIAAQSSASAAPPKNTASQQQQPLQKALTDELKGNFVKRPTLTSTNGAAKQQPVSQVAQQPQQLSLVTKFSQPQQVRLPPPNTTMGAPITASVSNLRSPNVIANQPVFTPTTTANVIKASTPAVLATTSTAVPTVTSVSSTQNVVVRKPTQTSTQMDEERRSKIIKDVTSALPAPSSLLYGSSSTSSLPSVAQNASASTSTMSRPTEGSSSHSQISMPAKKTSEPVLSTEVLQPVRLPSATVSVPKPVSLPTPHPVQPPPPPVVGNSASVDKKTTVPSQSTNVPLFNITNSSNMYPQLNSYPYYGSGYYPYPYSSGYMGYQGYNPYSNGLGQLALTNNALNALPPLVPSENRFSGTAQPLAESDIMELLGTQNRQTSQAAQQPATSQPAPSAAVPKTSVARATNDVSIADKMEVLYKEADFTQRGNCDTMVTYCKGDTELALKLLKQNHLVDIKLVDSIEKARQVLEACQYDLTAAANQILG